MTRATKKYDVLLVEPDLILAETFCVALQNAGFATLNVQTAQAAITALDAYKPKLIILELQLKSHNGIEFLYELRSYPDLQPIPVVLLTFISASAIALTKQQQERLNIHDYLYKPHTSLEKLTKICEGIINA